MQERYTRTQVKNSTKLTWLNVPYLPYPAFGAATKALS